MYILMKASLALCYSPSQLPMDVNGRIQYDVSDVGVSTTEVLDVNPNYCETSKYIFLAGLIHQKLVYCQIELQ